MSAGSSLSTHERKVVDWLSSQSGAMRALLETLVNIDSGSYNKAGARWRSHLQFSQDACNRF
jgi:hypothetical protein